MKDFMLGLAFMAAGAIVAAARAEKAVVDDLFLFEEPFLEGLCGQET